MDTTEIMRFMRAIWPRATDADFKRTDATVAIRSATDLLLDQRTRLADIDQFLEGPEANLAERIRAILKREGPAAIGGEWVTGTPSPGSQKK